MKEKEKEIKKEEKEARDRDEGGSRGAMGGDDRGEKRGFFRRRGCRFCADPDVWIDYKDKYLLKPFITERYKIVPRRISGNCAKHQRALTVAVKRARHLAVIPYSAAQIWSKSV